MQKKCTNCWCILRLRGTMSQEADPYLLDARTRVQLATWATSVRSSGDFDEPWRDIPDDLSELERMHTLFALAMGDMSRYLEPPFESRRSARGGVRRQLGFDTIEMGFCMSYLRALAEYSNEYPNRMDMLQEAFAPFAVDDETVVDRMADWIGAGANLMLVVLRSLPFHYVAQNGQDVSPRVRPALFANGFTVVKAMAATSLERLVGNGDESRIAFKYGEFGVLLLHHDRVDISTLGKVGLTNTMERMLGFDGTTPSYEEQQPGLGCPVLCSRLALDGLARSYGQTAALVNEQFGGLFLPRGRYRLPRPHHGGIIPVI